VGFKAVAVNVSDIAAMNAIPKQITVSIALSNRFSVEAVDALIFRRNQCRLCKHYGVDLVGGDTTASRSGSGNLDHSDRRSPKGAAQLSDPEPKSMTSFASPATWERH
jgi:thiamine monophosphate kinase